MLRHHIRQILIVLSAAAAALPGALALPSASAQEHGDATRGATLAVGVCVACHGVRKGEGSINPLAPPFTVIADVRGMSAMALNVALLSSHRSMPNIVLDPQERADVAAYILSLKSR
jgi:mono/diheme cytochrome c family protein